MDDVNAAAFQEAYKDLTNMYLRLTGSNHPTPSADRPHQPRYLRFEPRPLPSQVEYGFASARAYLGHAMKLYTCAFHVVCLGLSLTVAVAASAAEPAAPVPARIDIFADQRG